MTEKSNFAPHKRQGGTPNRIMGNMLLALSLIFVMAFFNFGKAALILCAASALAALATEILFCLLTGKTYEFDCSAIVTGLILALLLPAILPFWMAIIGAVFAILVVKMPFGGLGRNVFNPAAAGFVFLTVCFPEQIFTYPKINLFLQFSQSDIAGVIIEKSPAEILKEGGLPTQTLVDTLLGLFPGPLGATSVIILLCTATLIYFKRIRLAAVPVGFILAAAAGAVLFPRIPASPTITLDSLIFELSSGSLMFCALFMAPDPVTSPKNTWGRLIYGIGCGALAMLFRHVGKYEQSECVAVLIMNAVSPYCDRLHRKIELFRIAKTKARK